MTAFVDKESERPEVKATSDWTSDSIEIKLADMMVRFPSLDQQLSPFFTMDDSSTLLELMEDICEETRLPPPLPYFARRLSAPPTHLYMDEVVSSGGAPSLDNGRSGREFLRARNMTQSMPNFRNSRSLHNRGVGFSLSSASEFRDMKSKHLFHTRAAAQ